MPATDGTAFRRVLDLLGGAIVDGSLAAGSADTVDAIVARTGASRTVVREATRVLVALGMLSAGRRVGLRVRPRGDWDLLDPQLIRWRLASPDRAAQLAELLGLRLAVEPAAARRASERRSDAEAAGLREAVAALADATRARDRDAFLAADSRLHGRLLAAAGNAMLARLGAVIDEALRERTPGDRMRWEVAAADVADHEALVAAVVAGDAASAEALMRRIVDPGPPAARG
jgi:DNA-binding FadR family transcriptional regulator